MMVSMKGTIPMLALLFPCIHWAPGAAVHTPATAKPTPTMAIPLAIVVGQTFDLIYPWRPDWLQPSMLVSCKKCNRDPVSGTTPTINWGIWSQPGFAQGEDCKLGHNFTGGEDGQCYSAGCSAKDCKWEGQITLTNSGTISWAQAKIELDGAVMDEWSNVGPNEEKTWTFDANNPIIIDCKDTGTKETKTLKVRVLVNGKWHERSATLGCLKCS